mgnify:CR=1 FL=1
MADNPEQPNTDDPEATKPTEQAPPEQAEQKDDEKKFSQADLDRYVKERLDRDREKRAAEQKKADEAAEEKRLAEQSEFKRLAETRAEKIVDLEAQVSGFAAIQTERDEAMAVIQKIVDSELESAPDYVKDAISERSAIKQLEYLTAHRDKWTGEKRGIHPLPRPKAQNTSDEERAQSRAAMARLVKSAF